MDLNDNSLKNYTVNTPFIHRSCCKKAKEDSPPPVVSGHAPSSASPAASSQIQSQRQGSSASPRTASANPASVDPLSRMLSDAMSRVRVSETSGAPLNQATGSPSSSHAAARQQPQHPHDHLVSGQSPQLSRKSAASHQLQEPNKGATSTNEIPSFLMAIISKDKDSDADTKRTSSSQLNEATPASNPLLDALSGAGRSSNGDLGRQSGVPLSAEFLPASVMPSGLYSSGNSRPNSVNGHQQQQQQQQQHQHQQQQQQHPNQQQQQYHPSPSSTIAAASILNRPNGMPPGHGSPLQAPGLAYSPGMMPSPLSMPMMPGGHMQHPPPPQLNGGPHMHHPHPPPPPMPFPHHPGGPSMMGLPAPPPPPGGLGLPNFPADAMHAAMGAVGFMQQQQRGFVSNGAEVMPKAEFAQRFMGLLQTDPQFMDVLYSNYTAVLARRA